MDARANMRAMLENARQSIRSRAGNADGAARKAKAAATIASSTHSRKPTEARVTEAQPEGLHFQKDTTSSADAAADPSVPSAKDNQMQFVQHYYRLLCAFIEDKSKYELELPNLSALDRVVVHALAEKCNLSHESAGARAERVLHLKKDILFFQHPEAALKVNLDEVVEKVSWKESKYQIRYVRSANPAQVAVGDIGSYADEDALQKIERFKRATDEYRHATDMGYTQQELLLAEAGTHADGQAEADGDEYGVPANVEEILSRPDPSLPAITAGPSSSSSSSAPPASVSSPTASAAPLSTAARAMQAAAPSPAGRKAGAAAKTVTTVVLDEVCRTCGSRVRLDGPPQGWRCSHYCVHCTRQTIWSLEEVKVHEVAAVAGQSDALKRRRDSSDGALGGDGDAKRRRVEGAVEEIDRDENDVAEMSDEEDSDTDLTVEDVMEVAATNDFCAKDVNWLREFAASAGGAHIGRRIAFCIDFSDLADMPIFARYEAAPALQTASDDEAPAESKAWYVVLREVRDLGLAVSDLLRTVVSDAFAAPPPANATERPAVEAIQTEKTEQQAMEHLGVAFPNLSVYGAECVAVCQLRPFVRRASLPNMVISTDVLRALRQQYGERHVFASQSLSEALAHATQSSSS